MDKVYFSPWINNSTGLYERFSFNKKCFAFIMVIVNEPFTYQCSACFDGKSIYYLLLNNKETAMRHLDEVLISNGCKLLSKEQYDKYQLLI